MQKMLYVHSYVSSISRTDSCETFFHSTKNYFSKRSTNLFYSMCISNLTFCLYRCLVPIFLKQSCCYKKDQKTKGCMISTHTQLYRQPPSSWRKDQGNLLANLYVTFDVCPFADCAFQWCDFTCTNGLLFISTFKILTHILHIMCDESLYIIFVMYVCVLVDVSSS